MLELKQAINLTFWNSNANKLSLNLIATWLSW